MVSMVAWVILFIKMFSERAHGTKGIVPVRACAIPFLLYSPTASDYVCLSEVATACKTVTNRAEIIFEIHRHCLYSFLTLVAAYLQYQSLLKKNGIL